ncbi:MAG TPA: TlpA disulfide reductase family protein, partial [Draconibacterium sp.]|nr:TlpA disulfide reductase family protein [Draconibacterium sp.]
ILRPLISYNMNLSKFVIIVFTGILVLSGCKKSNQFTISGKITHADGKTLYLEELLVSTTRPEDSVKINKNGEFKFKGQSSIPTYYLLKFSDDKTITLLLDSLENVTVEADYANFSREYNVEGSPGSVLVKQLNDRLNTTRSKLDSLRSLEKMYRGNPDYNKLKTEWDKQYNKIIQGQVDYSTNFVMKNPFSMASILALYQQLDRQNYVIRDLHTMRVAASALNSIYPNSVHVKALYANTVQLLKDEQSAKMQKFIAENGQNSPDIVLPNPEGKEIALSSLRGKVVLLQFWSAVDRGSRILNPVLAEVYKEYKNKGFEIYQVSVDDNRIEWVDVIDKDHLSWINVGDMKGSLDAVHKFNIQTVPYNYLLDKEGRVVAQNLKGPGLTRALAGIFK